MAKRVLKKGIFITFEGIEGCGKTTHAKLLYKYLKDRGYKCVYTREPGGTRLGEEVRKILLNQRSVRISDQTELFLFEACRSQIVEEVIVPSLENKNIVICDRFTDATISYQGFGGGLDKKTIETLNRIASGGLVPDLTILLDVGTKEGLRRASIKGVDRIESKGLSYHEKVRRAYLMAAKIFPGRIKTVKACGEIPEVQERIRKEAENVIC